MESKKFNCKDFFNELKTLKKYIEIPDAKDEVTCLKKTARKVYEKLDMVRGIYEEILNPDISDLAISHEIRGIEIDLSELWKKYKTLIKLMREYELSLLLNDQHKIFEFLNKTDRQLEELIELAKKILENKIEFWSKDIKYRKPREYLG